MRFSFRHRPHPLANARASRAALSLVVLAVFGLSGSAVAQVPDGSMVVSSIQWPGFAGPGGLFFLDQHGGATVQPVTGLPAQVSTGVDWVLRRASDEALICDGGGLLNTPISLFVMPLSGAAVLRSTRYDLATVNNPGSFGCYGTLLVDERVLVAIDTSTMGAPGPLAGQLLGIVDPSIAPLSPGAVTPVPVSPIPSGQTRALALDSNRGVAYVSMVTGGTGSRASQVYAIPFPGGGAPAPVFSSPVPGVITSLALEQNGQLLAGGVSTPKSRVFRINPVSGALVHFPQTFRFQVWAVRRETVTGDIYFLNTNSASGQSSVHRITPGTPTGAVSLVTRGPTAGWGRISSIEFNPNPESYGAGSGGPATYDWVLSPNAGGLPKAPNAGFGLQIAASAVPQLSLVAVGTQRVSFAYPPLQILTLPIALFPIANGSLMTVPIPLTDPSTRGAQLFLQSFHVGASGNLGASRGVQFTIM